MARSTSANRIDAAKKAALVLLGASVLDDSDRSRAKLSSLRQAVDKLEKLTPPPNGREEFDLGLCMSQKIAFCDLYYFLYVLEVDREHWVGFAVDTLCESLDLMKFCGCEDESAEQFADNLSRIMQIRYYHVESMLVGAGKLTASGMNTLTRSMDILQKFRKEGEHGGDHEEEGG